MIWKKSHQRFEKKFYVSNCSIDEMMLIVKSNPGLFSEIFHQREVNNIYFDSKDLSFFKDNIEGQSKRMKVRIRWYNELFGKIPKPILELKIKNGQLGKKITKALDPLELLQNCNLDNFIYSLNNIIHNGIILKSLSPTLLNQYSRRYFLSNDEKIRITIDFNQFFYKLNKGRNSFMNNYSNQNAIILEIKYNKNDDKNIDQITNHFPFRVTKSSKYVSGVQKVFQLKNC